MTKKIDLFVYSTFSSSSFPKSSLLAPEQIYRQAKKAGMDFVTLTDINTIDGCLNFLEKYPNATDFITGEEVWCDVPDFKTTVSIGVYGITETQHLEILKRKENIEDLAPYLKEEGITHVLGHLLYRFAQSARHPATLSKLLDLFDVFEVHHGRVIDDHNIMSAYFIKGLSNKGICGGSHAKTLNAIGKTYTVCRARNREELLNQLSTGMAATEGAHATASALFRETYENSRERIKRLYQKKRYFSLFSMMMTSPFQDLKQLIAEMLKLRMERKQTPFYSALLGESQTTACYIPKEIIQI